MKKYPILYKEIRPWVKYGWEMILIVHEIIKTENPLKMIIKMISLIIIIKIARDLNENSWIAEDLQKMLR